MPPAELDGRLQTLLDKQDIQECVLKASRAMDRHDAELWAEAWHPDGTDDHGGWIGPASEFIHKSLLNVPRWRKHYHNLLNQSIDLDRDVATVETYYLAVLLHRDDDESDFSVGRYLDRVERRDAAWRIAHRLTVLDWTGTLPGPQREGSKIPDLTLFAQSAWDRSDPSYRRPLTLDRPFRNLYPDVR
jgi:SnoaL-like domain